MINIGIKLPETFAPQKGWRTFKNFWAGIRIFRPSLEFRIADCKNCSWSFLVLAANTN